MLAFIVAMLLTPQPQVAERTVHAGGTDVAVRCLGARSSGQPLVVLEAGGGNGLDMWSEVQSPIAAFARVCAYDRPTLIRGTVGPRAPSAPADFVRTLHEVLLALGEPPPYVMVGHSIGGMIVRLYATNYPTELTGMVLVDSAHEDQLERFDAIDPDTARELRAPASDEAFDLVAFSAALKARRWQSTIPLAVLTHGRTPPAPPGREAQTSALESTWLDLQRELATRSPAATHIIATRSGHYIQKDEPTLVIDAVHRVVSDAQRAAKPRR